jgi:hypothetical protein
MTHLEFVALCGEYLIDPDIALESDDVIAALEDRDDDEVERILRYDF